MHRKLLHNLAPSPAPAALREPPSPRKSLRGQRPALPSLAFPRRVLRLVSPPLPTWGPSGNYTALENAEEVSVDAGAESGAGNRPASAPALKRRRAPPGGLLWRRHVEPHSPDRTPRRAVCSAASWRLQERLITHPQFPKEKKKRDVPYIKRSL